MATAIQELAQTFAVLTPKQEIKPVDVTPSFYPDLDKNFPGFKEHVLIAIHNFSEDWQTWEVHPKGDELVLLMSGKAEMILKTEQGEESVVLEESGSYVVVPRGAWHTARVSEPTQMLFVTSGEGTQNSEHPE